MKGIDEDKLLKLFEKEYRIFEYLMLMEILRGYDCKKQLRDELRKMQNDDGGFKGVMEPDIRSYNSAVISTAEALDLYRFSGGIDDDVKKKVIDYLNAKYDEEYLGWHIASGEIYDKPRAFWWNKDIEETFGYANPTAMIIGFVEYFSMEGLKADTGKIYQNLVENELDTDNMHDYMSLVSMFRLMDKKLPDKLISAGEKLIQWNSEKWDEYGMGPSDVIDHPEHPLFEKYKKEVYHHLDYLKNKLTENGFIDTSWTWGQYEEYFSKAQLEWRGILTLKLIRKLKRFNYYN